MRRRNRKNTKVPTYIFTDPFSWSFSIWFGHCDPCKCSLGPPSPTSLLGIRHDQYYTTQHSCHRSAHWMIILNDKCFFQTLHWKWTSNVPIRYLCKVQHLRTKFQSVPRTLLKKKRWITRNSVRDLSIVQYGHSGKVCKLTPKSVECTESLQLIKRVLVSQSSQPVPLHLSTQSCLLKYLLPNKSSRITRHEFQSLLQPRERDVHSTPPL